MPRRLCMLPMRRHTTDARATDALSTRTRSGRRTVAGKLLRGRIRHVPISILLQRGQRLDYCAIGRVRNLRETLMSVAEGSDDVDADIHDGVTCGAQQARQQQRCKGLERKRRLKDVRTQGRIPARRPRLSGRPARSVRTQGPRTASGNGTAAHRSGSVARWQPAARSSAGVGS